MNHLTMITSERKSIKGSCLFTDMSYTSVQNIPIQ
jgi:hypothetical protein